MRLTLNTHPRPQPTRWRMRECVNVYDSSGLVITYYTTYCLGNGSPFAVLALRCNQSPPPVLDNVNEVCSSIARLEWIAAAVYSLSPFKGYVNWYICSAAIDMVWCRLAGTLVCSIGRVRYLLPLSHSRRIFPSIMRSNPKRQNYPGSISSKFVVRILDLVLDPEEDLRLPFVQWAHLVVLV